MRAVNVTIDRTVNLVGNKYDERDAFWAQLGVRDIGRDMDRDVPPEVSPDWFENRLRNRFPRYLTESVQRALSAQTIDREHHDSYFLSSERVERPEAVARIMFRIQRISYGSLKIELGIPDPDAVLDVLGNNVEVLEALLDQYVPEAFNRATGTDESQFQFKVKASPELDEYASNRVVRPTPVARRAIADSPVPENHKEDARQRGVRIAAELVKSPLIFPVLLICFLWYVARQDTLAERQIVSGLMQTLIQQQTATTSVLRMLL